MHQINYILTTVPTHPDNRFLKRMQKIASLLLQGTIDILYLHPDDIKSGCCLHLGNSKPVCHVS